MSVTVVPSPIGFGWQFLNNAGSPLAGGQIFTYQAGTTTPQTTYTTSTGNVAQANPIILDSAGRVPNGGEIWLINAGYKFVIQDANNNTIMTLDNINTNVISGCVVQLSNGSVAWTVPAGGTGSRIPFDTRLYDNLSEMDVVTNKGRFTAQNTGTYLVTFAAEVNIAASQQVVCFLYKNGLTYALLNRSIIAPVGGSTATVSGSVPVKLSAGDYLEVFAGSNAGGSSVSVSDPTGSGNGQVATLGISRIA